MVIRLILKIISQTVRNSKILIIISQLPPMSDMFLMERRLKSIWCLGKFNQLKIKPTLCCRTVREGAEVFNNNGNYVLNTTWVKYQLG
jgi:hypothetical protein